MPKHKPFIRTPSAALCPAPPPPHYRLGADELLEGGVAVDVAELAKG